MTDALLQEAESLLARMPQLFPDERERVRAALARGNAAARAAILEKLRASVDEYAVRGAAFEKKAGKIFDQAAARLKTAERGALQGARERAERSDREAEGPADDLLSRL